MITIAKKQYPCRITMGAMLRFKRETGKELSAIDRQEFTEILTFLFCCVTSACSADGVDFPYDLEQFADRIPIEDAEKVFADLNLSDTESAGVKKKK